MEDRQEALAQGEQIWLGGDKYAMVFSQAGKPIYATHPDPLQLSSLFGLMQALLAKTQNRLQVIRAGNQKVCFSVFGPMIIVISSKNHTPVSFLQRQAEFLYGKILFHFTLFGLEDAYRRNPGYDLRSMLGNTYDEMGSILDMADENLNLLLNAAPSQRMPADLRNSCSNVLSNVRQSNLLYAILLARGKFVTLVQPKRHPMQPSDLILLLNFVQNANQLRSQETWTPLCLPAFNSTGFLHAYAAYLSENVCLLLLSSGESLDQFHYCSEAKETVKSHLFDQGLLTKLETLSNDIGLSTGDVDAASAIHVVYKSLKFGQYFETESALHAPLHTKKDLLEHYIDVHERLLAREPCSSIIKPTDDNSLNLSPLSIEGTDMNEIFDIRGSEAVYAVHSPGSHIVFASFHVYIGVPQATASVNRFITWAQKNKNDLFLTKMNYW